MTGKLLQGLVDRSPAAPSIISSAILGHCPSDHELGPVYRYVLGRYWDTSKPRLLYVMLNPSIADADIDDPTIRVCIGRAHMMGYGSIRVVNLFAFRATSPIELYDHVRARNLDYIIGPENDEYIYRELEDTETGAVLCAWGGHGTLVDRGRTVRDMIHSIGWKPLVIGLTSGRDPQPVHPLRQSYNNEAYEWN